MDCRSLVLVCLIGGVFAAQPSLKPAMELVEKSQNDSLVVFCSTSATNELVTWSDPKGKMILSTAGRVHVESRGSLGMMLMFDRVEASDRGRYTCTSASKDNSSFELSVVKTSQFVSTPTVHRVSEYQNTFIRCEVVGEPKPSITWQRNGLPIEGSLTQKYIPEAKGLKVINASKTDSGVFTCRALQVGKEDGFVESVDITFRVQHKPEWRSPTSGSVMAYGFIGGETNLTCDAVAEPEANYTWYRSGKEIKHQKLNVTEILVGDKSVLQIFMNSEAVYGQYQCQARNSLGHIKRSFELLRGEQPPPPIGFDFKNATNSTVTMNINSDAKELLGYRVQFVITRPGEEVVWDQPEFQDVQKSSDGLYTIKDLLEYTGYAVRVSTRTPAGLSNYTEFTGLMRTERTTKSSCSIKASVQVLLLISAIVLLFVH